MDAHYYWTQTHFSDGWVGFNVTGWVRRHEARGLRRLVVRGFNHNQSKLRNAFIDLNTPKVRDKKVIGPGFKQKKSALNF